MVTPINLDSADLAVRLEALALAAQRPDVDVVAEAQRYYDFITTTTKM